MAAARRRERREGGGLAEATRWHQAEGALRRVDTHQPPHTRHGGARTEPGGRWRASGRAGAAAGAAAGGSWRVDVDGAGGGDALRKQGAARSSSRGEVLTTDKQLRESKAALRAAFDKFDADGSGKIDGTELKLVFRELEGSLGVTAKQAAALTAACDADGDVRPRPTFCSTSQQVFLLRALEHRISPNRSLSAVKAPRRCERRASSTSQSLPRSRSLSRRTAWRWACRGARRRSACSRSACLRTNALRLFQGRQHLLPPDEGAAHIAQRPSRLRGG